MQIACREDNELEMKVAQQQGRQEQKGENLKSGEGLLSGSER